jgi:hypothetical protein
MPRWGQLSRKPTLLGRAIILISGEVLANVVCWIAAALALRQADGLLGLALLAWVSHWPSVLRRSELGTSGRG